MSEDALIRLTVGAFALSVFVTIALFAYYENGSGPHPPDGGR